MQVCRDASRTLINPPLSVFSRPPSLSTYSCNEHMSCKWNRHILLIATLEVKQFLLSSISISLRAHAVATHLVWQFSPCSCYKTQISKAAVDLHLHLHLSDLMYCRMKTVSQESLQQFFYTELTTVWLLCGVPPLAAAASPELAPCRSMGLCWPFKFLLCLLFSPATHLCHQYWAGLSLQLWKMKRTELLANCSSRIPR